MPQKSCWQGKSGKREDRPPGSARDLLFAGGDIVTGAATVILAMGAGRKAARSIHGTFRVAVLVPRYGEGAGHVISTLLLCVLIALLSWFAIGWIHPATPAQAAAVGGLWLALTLVFEFGFGHFGAHKTWTELLADYNVRGGRIWLLVLVTTTAAPYFMGRLRGLF